MKIDFICPDRESYLLTFSNCKIITAEPDGYVISLAVIYHFFWKILPDDGPVLQVIGSSMLWQFFHEGCMTKFHGNLTAILVNTNDIIIRNFTKKQKSHDDARGNKGSLEHPLGNMNVCTKYPVQNVQQTNRRFHDNSWPNLAKKIKHLFYLYFHSFINCHSR